MTPEFNRGFQEEREKIAWSGKYYHGTTPLIEELILREGLDPAKGGSEGGALGAMRRGQEIYEKSWNPQKRMMAELQRPMLEGMAPTTGKVFVTPSKTVARAYSVYANYPDSYAAGQRVARHPIKAIRRFFRQPLEVDPEVVPSLHLRPDPDSPLAYYTEKKIPAGKVRKAERTGETIVDLRKALRAVLRSIKKVK